MDTLTNAGGRMPGVADRRRSHRFSLRLPVRCRRIGRPCPTIISETVNISSKGLLFTTTEALLPGQVVEAFIDWPARLDNHVRLTLVVEGPVVTKVGDRTAMRIERYQFRTRGAGE
jgi:hypothetical protein